LTSAPSDEDDHGPSDEDDNESDDEEDESYDEEDDGDEDDGDDDLDEDFYDDDEEEDDEDEADDTNFDVSDAALEQIRYRLEVAKIDPSSLEGANLLDALLVKLQETNERHIDMDTINIFMDELMFGSEHRTSNGGVNNAPEGERADDEEGRPHASPAQCAPPSAFPFMNTEGAAQQIWIEIYRSNKKLGRYFGGVDDGGYVRQGCGTMYYDAGHECHGTWENDVMTGRGVYRWADGHAYEGEWSEGKRHGLGKFIRPDGVVLLARYEKGHQKNGVRWSADRKEAQLVVDGMPKKTVTLEKANTIAEELGFDEDVPPPL